MDSVDLDALEGAALAKLPPGAAAFMACGADDEITVAENSSAWSALRLRPRVLRGVTAADTSTRLLGSAAATPIMVAPMGRHKLFHPEGEAATARGASRVGAGFILPTYATETFARVGEERTTAPQWFQLYLGRDRDIAAGLVDGAASAGFSAVLLTVDQPVGGWAPRAARNPIPRSEAIRHENIPGRPLGRTAYDPTQRGVVNHPNSLEDLAWLVARSPLPVLVKGVLRADDALACLATGARGVVVSNHGGRHLDTAVTSAEALPGIVAALAGRGEIYVDGGIRRGTDVLKALALGARGVLVGRPVLWGLTVDGASGVADVLGLLTAELGQAMIQCGAATLADLDPDLVAQAMGGPATRA